MKSRAEREDGVRTALRDREEVVGRLGTEVGLTRGEALLYLELLERGSLPASPRSKELAKLEAGGMTILSGDGSRYVPTHPRLGVSNHYRTWREQVVREINERRMKVDRLILELIPLYEAATDKRREEEGGKKDNGL